MKNLILSSVLAVSSLFAVAAPSYADTVTVTTTQRSMERPMHREEYRPRHYQRVARDCFVKKVRTHHHGRVVVKETRVCR